MIMTEILTNEQSQAVESASKAIEKGDKLFRIGGYAGTGKTTIARHIVEKNEGAMVCAFTGKAAYRLQQKGLSIAQTIHRTIYDYDPGNNKFHRKGSVDGKYFLIDEGSMVSTPLWEDITHFDKPVILLGDPGQLEPVGKDPNLMKDPDIVLDKIHRQAEQSGIIRFATDIRLGKYNNIRLGFINLGDKYPDVYIDRGPPSKEDVLWADIIICGFNATRHKINKWYRQINGYKGLINKNEQVICLKNNMEIGVFNGQILTISAVHSHYKGLYFTADTNDDGELFKDMPFWTDSFGRNVKQDKIKNIRLKVIADYSYAITCHKSQGSEWDKVLVIDQQCPRAWEPARWRYTAITRASRELRYYFV